MRQQWSVDEPRTIDLGQVEKVKIRVVGGHVDVVGTDGLSGSVEGQTASGDLETRRLRGDLTFKTVSGDLTVVDGESEAVWAKTVSGDVTVDLVTPGRHRLDVDSVSGDVTVRLPEDTDLEVDVRTTSGDVDSAFSGLHRVRKPGKSQLGGTLGGGGGRLAARTVSGDVAILQRTQPEVRA